jgi:hypothetical protein
LRTCTAVCGWRWLALAGAGWRWLALKRLAVQLVINCLINFGQSPGFVILSLFITN